jgi:hypothetical protein
VKTKNKRASDMGEIELVFIKSGSNEVMC